MAVRRAGGALAAGLVLLMGVLGWAVSAWYTCAFQGCPDVAQLRGYVPREASVVLDRWGTPIARLYRVSRRVVPLDALPAYVPRAFVAVEDKRFWMHHGVDWRRIPGAALADLRSGGFVQGFSTITMQLARNLFPDRLPAVEKSPLRKLAEMRVAMLVEQQFGKRDILQMYLNQIYFGRGAWGIEAAAEEYFGRPASRLTLAQAATLAALPRSPSRLNPRTDRAAARARRDLVLRLMAAQGYVSRARAARAERQPIRLARGLTEGTQQEAPYFLEEVRQRLEDRLGDAIYTQGLRIHTTLDLPTQRLAERELERQLEAIEAGRYGVFRHARYDPRLRASADTSEQGPAYLQGALLMLDSRTGDVRAWVGGRDFAQSRFDRVTRARRQAGSAFKPFVYAAAVAAGYPPTYTLLDEPLTVWLPGGRSWSPRDYEGDYLGPISLDDALAESRNVPAVRLASRIGPARIVETARELGIRDPLPAVPSLALGVADVTPSELIDAYTAFSSPGERAEPRLITRVEDRTGHVVWSQPALRRPALDPAVAFVMTSMLERVVDGGTGAAVRSAGYAGPAAGKTGTTQSNSDAWFVGVTPRVTLGIWIGFDRPTPITASATGGTLAAPVWGRIMARAGLPGGHWTPPPGVEERWALPGGGLLAAACPRPEAAQPLWFLAGTAPLTGDDCAGPGSLAGTGRAAYDALAAGRPPVPGETPGRGWWDWPSAPIFGGSSGAAPAPGPAEPAAAAASGGPGARSGESGVTRER